MELVYKNFSVATKTIDAEAGVYSAMISTETTDRQGDIVRAAGGKFDNYLKNPVVMWAHDYNELPVAKTTDLEIIPGTGVRATFQFPELGTSEKADAVRRLWAGGFLGATSIGFAPIKATPIESGWDFTEWEMLEFSIVPVPANAEALRLAMKAIEGIPAQADETEAIQSDTDEANADANTDDLSNDATEAYAEELIARMLNQTIQIFKEVLK